MDLPGDKEQPTKSARPPITSEALRSAVRPWHYLSRALNFTRCGTSFTASNFTVSPSRVLDLTVVSVGFFAVYETVRVFRAITTPPFRIDLAHFASTLPAARSGKIHGWSRVLVKNCFAHE